MRPMSGPSTSAPKRGGSTVRRRTPSPAFVPGAARLALEATWARDAERAAADQAREAGRLAQAALAAEAEAARLAEHREYEAKCQAKEQAEERARLALSGWEVRALRAAVRNAGRAWNAVPEGVQGGLTLAAAAALILAIVNPMVAAPTTRAPSPVPTPTVVRYVTPPELPRTRCADGSTSNSTGSGTCSWHGGIG